MLLKRLLKLPGIRHLVLAWKWRRFKHAEHCNLFWGVLASFSEATALAPKTKPLGYDHPEAAEMYRQLLTRAEPSDYAVLYWLEKLAKPGDRVFDFGGHVGVRFYVLSGIAEFVRALRWVVYDVPAVVRAGRQLAEERKVEGLSFTEDTQLASGADVYLAMGALQYVEPPLHERLKELKQLPRVVIISTAPMVQGPRFVTLQNIGTAFCPYLIESRPDLERGMSALGYRILAEWMNPEKSCPIMNQLDSGVYGYTSLVFERI